ncbi:huntingtin-associated protein 1 isoform 2 [Homo sapiens]|uniref:Isoform 2 of Huntingtin-associated protein 1 n=1 Tax=Homo sapiens TaxID=9606 RepID=P54257-2|nr:huntingtin-associated protein 1 isoform 2 [Homo sapiens]|eukprot:NP_817084.2 huntingtin-associated protein 1 isoform 2 [Homo sapiens]
MRPKRLGRCCAGSRLGPGDPAALTCAPSPSASPAPEPSAQPQARGTGQRVGSRATSGSQFLSEARTGARPASEAGAKAGARRPSAFSAIQGDVRSMPDNSDAPWTRFVFQGPFGSRATGRGTGKAAGIWKTPAAYVGRRPGVSGPERAAFIRELEEALCPNLPPPVKKITQEDVKVMLYLLEELLPPVWESVTYGMVLQRERDLNTAARIGQSLVKQNSVLMEENSKLEALLGSAKEEILYLRHQVNLRDELLQLYSDSDEEDEDEEEEEEEKEAEEEQEEEEAEEDLQCAHPCDAPKLISQEALLHQHHCPQLEALQEKLRLLEEENHQLREEASQLDTLEDEEQMLILECVEQFSEASQQMAELSEVLVLRLENYERQQQEVARLQAQVLKLQQRCRMYGAETEKLQKQLASEKEIQMQLQEEETLPGFQETLAEELRTSLRRMISDPVYFMERNYEMPRGDTSSLRYDFRYSEDREQVRGFEAEEGLMLAADIMRGEDFTPAEEFVPQEELGAAKKVPAEEGVMEEAELVSEETEGWEEVELELDEATRMNVVTSALEASGLGPSHLDMNYVLQQLANWQDAHYRRQLRWKMLQKGECPHGALPAASRTSCRSSCR